MTRTRWILAGVIVSAVANSSYMAILWWLAALGPNWSVSPVFNSIGEQWIEGLFFHLCTGVSIYAIWYFRPGGRYAAKPRNETQTRRVAMPQRKPSANDGVRDTE
jgi:hypothetical protein